MYWVEFMRKAKDDCFLVCIHGIVYDVSEFINDYSGGPDIFEKFVGLNVSLASHGGHHALSPHAESRLPSMQVASIKDLQDSVDE